MNQKKLHKMVDTIASQSFSSETEMLIAVLNQIVDNEKIDVTGGRIWRLDINNDAYSLLYQIGKVEKINPDFLVKLSDYPHFDRIAKERTIFGSETNQVLLQKGIFRYSASGVG